MVANSKIDAIVVLGAAVWTDEVASPTLKRRTDHAVEAFHRISSAQDRPPIMVLSGGVGRNPPSEAEVMARLCRAAGVPENALLLEDRSASTMENALFSADLLHQRDAESLLIVTDRYHMRRALMVFRRLGFQCEGSGPPRGPNATWFNRVVMPIRDWLALPYYWVLLRLSTKTQKARHRPGSLD